MAHWINDAGWSLNGSPACPLLITVYFLRFTYLSRPPLHLRLQELEAPECSTVEPMVATMIARTASRAVAPFGITDPSRVQPSTLEIESEHKLRDVADGTWAPLCYRW